jgi:hypothetical protein
VSETVLNKQAELISDINGFPDVFYTSSRGVNEINIVLSNSVNALVEKHFANEKLIQKLENLASITVKLPKRKYCSSRYLLLYIPTFSLGRHYYQRGN